jgi:hypothetical protein
MLRHAGALAVAIAAFALAQKMTGYESKTWAAVLIVVGSIFLVWFVWWSGRDLTLWWQRRGLPETGGAGHVNKLGNPIEILRVENPQGMGWVTKEGNWRNVAISVAHDAPVEGCVNIDPHGARFAMDKIVGQDSRFCKQIHFLAKFTDASLIYAHVRLRPRAGTGLPQDYWLTYVLGDEKQGARPDYRYTNEVAVFVSGDSVSNGWREFTRMLADDVQLAYGSRGLVFSELQAIRIRGSLAISPIWLCA